MTKKEAIAEARKTELTNVAMVGDRCYQRQTPLTREGLKNARVQKALELLGWEPEDAWQYIQSGATIGLSMKEAVYKA